MPYRRLRPDEVSRMVSWHLKDPERWTFRALAERFHCSPETAHRRVTRAIGNRDAHTEGSVAGVAIPPKLASELTPQNRAYLEDFRAWRYRFLDRDAPAFQLEMIGAITGGEDVVVLVPPGHGKTTLITHDFVIWDMLRHRCQGEPYACLLISSGADMARAFLANIRRTLERNKALIEGYGSFRPEENETWKQGALAVWWTGDDEGRRQRKEPTFIAAGRGTQIYGWRVKRIIVDDLIGKKESLSPEQTVSIAEWLHEIVESRLNKGTNIAFVGTRFSPHEVYGHLLEARDRQGRPLYKHVIYRAHDDAKCSGVECGCDGECKHHPAYPEGCTLWPQEWPHSALMRIKSKLDLIRSGRFDFVYNQLETSSSDALCQKEWTDRCKDHRRFVWELPQGGRVPGRVICTLDPSAENWTVMQAWAYVSAWEQKVDQPCHFLLAQLRARLTGPQIVGRIKEWTIRLREMGVDPSWIVEVNAFQKWLIQFNDFRQMRYDLGGLTVIPHSTSKNKLDNEFGVYALGPPFEFGKVSIPWASREEWDMFTPFIRELITYPGAETNDCVMAAWFYIHHVKRMARPREDQAFIEMPGVPPYLVARRKQVAMYV